MIAIKKYISKLKNKPSKNKYLVSEIDATYQKISCANQQLINNLSPSVQLMIEFTDLQGYTSWASIERKLGLGVVTPSPRKETIIYGISVGCAPKNGSKNYNNNDRFTRIGKPVVCMFQDDCLNVEQMTKALVAGWIKEALKHNSSYRIISPMVKSKLHSINEYKVINLEN